MVYTAVIKKMTDFLSKICKLCGLQEMSFVLMRSVQPVYPIELGEQKYDGSSDTAITATGHKVLVHPEKGKRWRVKAIEVGIVDGTFTIDRIEWFPFYDSTDAHIAVWSGTAAAFASVQCSQDIIVTWQNGLGINVAAKTVDGHAYIGLIVTEEDDFE